MSRPDAPIEEPIVARVVHRSVVVDQPGLRPVVKLMLNLPPGGRDFAPGTDVAFLASNRPAGASGRGLRRYSIDAVGEVPFEDSVDITIHVRDHGSGGGTSMARRLIELNPGDTIPVYGPFPYPFYPPMGSRSNMILIGAGCGMVPFRWLAHKVQARRLDWMGKVLMLEGPQTGLERLYLNEPGRDQDHYFDSATQRAFDALKTRYSATALDRAESTRENMDALWRLLGQGSVFVYLAGYRQIAEAMDEAMAQYLRLPGRWEEAKGALVRDGHWLEYLYD
jgi:NAD(P)H-flavin reductase